MKISPVQGTPTIPNPSSSGISPDKLERLKAIAAGKPQEQAPEKEIIPQVMPASNKTIKMTTNRNPEAIDAPQEAPIEAPSVPENVISDPNVQTKPAPEAIQQVSPQVAALAKEKRALQVRARELEEKEKALNAQGTRAELEERIKSNALSVLQELGVTYDQLTEQILGKQTTPDFNKVKEDILKAVEEKIAGKDVAQAEAVFEHMSKNVNKLTIASDNYPFIKAGKAQDKVMSLIRRSWEGDEKNPEVFPGGEVLDEEEAMQLIEMELKEEARNYAKLLKEPEPTTPAAVEQSPTPPAPKAPGIKTLTNKDSARPGMSRRQRAIAAMLNQTK